MTNALTPKRLRELGAKYLTTNGILLFDEYIENGDIQKAKEFLLGALDALWTRGELESEVVAPLYKEIGVSPERASMLRQMTQTS